jgi:hypothetical protein
VNTLADLLFEGTRFPVGLAILLGSTLVILGQEGWPLLSGALSYHYFQRWVHVPMSLGMGTTCLVVAVGWAGVTYWVVTL